MSLHDEYLRFLDSFGLSIANSAEPEKLSIQAQSEIICRMQQAAEVDQTVKMQASDEFTTFVNRVYSKGQTLNEILQSHKLELEIAVKRSKTRLNVPVYFGVFPTGSFNALATPCSEGFLLLINQGSYNLIQRFCLALSHTIAFAELPKGVVFASGVPNDASFGDQHITRQDCVEIMARVLLDYVETGKSTFKDDIPMPSPIKFSCLVPLADSVMKFMIAHEFAHAILEHHKANCLSSQMTHMGELKVAKMSWDQERAADLKACHLMTQSSLAAEGTTGPIRVDNRQKELELQYTIAGPLVFFAIADAIESIKTQLNNYGKKTISDTHPPPLNRLELSLEFFKRINASHSTQLGVLMAQSILTATKDIVSVVTYKIGGDNIDLYIMCKKNEGFAFYSLTIQEGEEKRDYLAIFLCYTHYAIEEIQKLWSQVWDDGARYERFPGGWNERHKLMQALHDELPAKSKLLFLEEGTDEFSEALEWLRQKAKDH